MSKRKVYFLETISIAVNIFKVSTLVDEAKSHLKPSALQYKECDSIDTESSEIKWLMCCMCSSSVCRGATHTRDREATRLLSSSPFSSSLTQSRTTAFA